MKSDCILFRKGSFTCFLLCCSFQVFNIASAEAQGCSDAGICSLPAFRPKGENVVMEEDLNRIAFGISAGAADHSIAVLGATLDYSRSMGSTWKVDARVTMFSQSGNQISVTGPGDVYLNMGFRPVQAITLTGGLKIPLMQADKTDSGLPLPMDYQSSLGTTDLILGFGWTWEKWQVVIGFQQPLTQNRNAFLAASYPVDSPLAVFQSTNEFQRKGDVLLRVSYPVYADEQVSLTASLLPIYHTGPDRYTDVDGISKEIGGSDGLTINGTLHAELKMRKSGSVQISIGFPFLVRESRPDGLTRGGVIQAAYGFRF